MSKEQLFKRTFIYQRHFFSFQIFRFLMGLFLQFYHCTNVCVCVLVRVPDCLCFPVGEGAF